MKHILSFTDNSKTLTILNEETGAAIVLTLEDGQAAEIIAKFNPKLLPLDWSFNSMEYIEKWEF
jgi:hypothetical protein